MGMMIRWPWVSRARYDAVVRRKEFLEANVIQTAEERDRALACWDGDFAATGLTSGDVVGIANIIASHGQYRTVEDCARAVVPAVIDLLRAYAPPRHVEPLDV
jgi:hypothetical protein